MTPANDNNSDDVGKDRWDLADKIVEEWDDGRLFQKKNRAWSEKEQNN